jgi:hypothetical protein
MFKQLNAIIEPRVMKIRHLDKRIRVLHKRIVKEHQEMLKELNPLPKKDARK